MTDAAMQAAAEALHDGGPDRYTACVMGQDCGIRAEHTKLWITEAEAAVATREAADAKKADRNTAREVRRQWLAGRVGSLIVKDAERADLLRILLLDYLEYGEVTEADEALSGIPPMGDRNTITDEQREWIAAANENRLWKALLVLTFGLATCGSEQWPHDHWQSIRVAQALGYEPSDVEVELLGGAT